MTHWVWAPDPLDVWFGPFDDPEPERDRLLPYYASTTGLQIVEDSKLVRRRVELSNKRYEED